MVKVRCAKALVGGSVSPLAATFSVVEAYGFNEATTSSLCRPLADMPREAEISVNERAFIQQALQEGLRLDGRAFDTFRPLQLTFGDEYGVADVQLGKTRYMSMDQCESRYANYSGLLCGYPSKLQRPHQSVNSMESFRSSQNFLPWHLLHLRLAGEFSFYRKGVLSVYI
jgi:hypothetical protein